MSKRSELKDEVYLAAALNIAELSKDPNTKVGAKIIASDGSPVSEGRNGSSRNIADEYVPYTREFVKIKYQDIEVESNKYPFMIHAEENALLFANDRHQLVGATIYVTHMPCPSCASKISQTGISRVVCPKGSIATMTGNREQLITKYIFKTSNIRYEEI